jgi:hypothetical protein
MKKLKKYATSITVITPDRNTTYIPGPIIEAESFEEADLQLKEKNLEYCTVRYEIEFEDEEWSKPTKSPQDLLCLQIVPTEAILC